MSDPMRASVWGQYRQMANSLGTASLDNASLMSSYNQHQQAMSAVMTGSMVPPSMTSYGSQFPLMHWNPLNPYSNIEQALANANGIAGCPGCMKKAVEELSDHFVNAFLAGITNKFRNCSSHHICNTPTANGGGSSQSDSSVTIPALSNPNHEHLEINTPIVPNNLPKPQPTFRPYI
ncbi:hypothetical protein Y032_0011g1550 [Ancylostoma ceylanicum]|nr:hypothetical protein Y032_0011g1550 [Ancylostoma ceylanicum]